MCVIFFSHLPGTGFSNQRPKPNQKKKNYEALRLVFGRCVCFQVGKKEKGHHESKKKTVFRTSETNHKCHRIVERENNHQTTKI